MPNLSPLDTLIIAADNALRTLLAPASSQRPHPDQSIEETPLADSEKKHAAALMRINHCGEICAQALYQGQALTARQPHLREALQHAAAEETEHLAWTAQRVHQLGSHTSVLNPLWYAGSLAIGVTAGLIGDKWNLGFLAETEEQVVAHLDDHLGRLPEQDAKSRAIVEQMRIDEAQHADTAREHGAADLPAPIQWAMKTSSRVMTGLSYYV